MTATNANSAAAAVNDSAFNDLIDELTERLQSGKNVNIDAFVAQHAEHADAIRQLLPALEVLADLPHTQAARANSVALAEDPGLKSGAVGDFQILREIGRGGMGVVYEAKQLSLNRHVALKVLPFAATMDSRQLQRFHHEAQAAAMLHHPHIVPVFGVGSDRGIHYYAMQLIRGRSLAQFVTALRGGNVESPPDATAEFHNGQQELATTRPVAAISTKPGSKDKAHYRRLAELMAHAADALEYAHSMGVIHRDVKPGNLLLDDGGHLWVTDFGLAKLESGVGMTMTGDLVGTLRYMSPEQALAKHGLVDHRTDVYSLGATLYELLTLQPPVDGADKHEVLRKIAFAEPAAPRTLASSIPFELETVTLKCMAKEPGERYASAAELAEDLRRFIEDRPVVARRSTSAERVWRWARRNPVVASLLTLVFVILLGGLTATYSQWRRADENAQKYRDAAEAAIFQQSVAQRESNLSWRAVRGTLLGLSASSQQHTAADLRRQIFAQMAKLNDELSADPSSQRKFDRALITLGLGQARAEAGSLSAGLKNMQEGLTLLDELVRDEPDNQEYREQLCCALRVNANFLYTTNAAQAEVLARRAVVEVRRLLAETPSANRRFELAGALRMWSRTLEALKRPDQEPRRESNDLCRQIIADNPNGVMLEAPLALATNLRDDSRRLTGNGTVNTAVELAREAVQVTDECVKRFPRRTEVLLGASQSCGVMASALYRRKDWAAALEQYQRSLGLARELLQIEPANTMFQNNLNIALGTMAMGLAQLQRYDDAHRALDEGTPAQQRIIAIHKERVAYRQTLYHLLRNRCRVYGMAGDHKSAARAAAELAQLNYGSGVDAADATLYLVQNISAASIDRALSASERKTIATEYQIQALEYLKLADARGYADAQRLRTRYFEPLHGQPEFQTLLRRIAARASPSDDALRDD